MKQVYAMLPAVRLFKRLFFLLLFLGAFGVSESQVYYATLSGTNEIPPTPSAGNGRAVVTISGTTMRVQVSFSGLTGTTTASHIHAPTAAPETGNAGVATTTPTFAGFPLGVTAGTYDNTLDMTMTSSYNPAYLMANGGSPAAAFAALQAAMAAGRSYLNVHTNLFPGGEIRGFLLPCPAINVMIPDAVAMSQGVLPNTVYPAYAPASSLTLHANVSGGTGPYHYTWSDGSMAGSLTVRPTAGTVYTVTVTDQNGCPSNTASKTVAVVDVASGKKGDKVDVCHNGNSLSIAMAAVDAHLRHGDRLGGCSQLGQSLPVRRNVSDQLETAVQVRVLSNPSSRYFDLQLSGHADGPLQVRVFDLLGRVVEARPSVQTNQTVRIGTLYQPGTYLVQVAQGQQVQTLRLLKTK